MSIGYGIGPDLWSKDYLPRLEKDTLYFLDTYCRKRHNLKEAGIVYHQPSSVHTVGGRIDGRACDQDRKNAHT